MSTSAMESKLAIEFKTFWDFVFVLTFNLDRNWSKWLILYLPEHLFNLKFAVKDLEREAKVRNFLESKVNSVLTFNVLLFFRKRRRMRSLKLQRQKKPSPKAIQKWLECTQRMRSVKKINPWITSKWALELMQFRGESEVFKNFHRI